MNKVATRMFGDQLKVGYTKAENIAINGLTFAGIGIVIEAMIIYSSTLPEIFMAKIALAITFLALSLMLTVVAMRRRIKHDNGI